MKSVSDWNEKIVLGLPLGEFDWFEAKGRKALDLTLPQVEEHHVRQTLSVALSAFANTGGGQLIYGLKNPQVADGKWLADDGGVSTSVKGDTREWLETVIPSLVDSPVTSFNVYQILPTGPDSQIASGRALYVIDIRDSIQAPHQAFDNKYYIRVAGRSRPAGHRLVLDIMGRRQYPKIDLDFEIEVTTKERPSPLSWEPPKKTSAYALKITARNTGRVYSQYVNSFILVPVDIVHEFTLEHGDPVIVEEEGKKYCEFYEDNTVRDVVGVGGSVEYSYPKYGPSRFDPILPGLSHSWSITLHDDFGSIAPDDLKIKWSTYADSAPPNEGEVEVSSIPMVVKQKP
jgi:hypothetical protein